MVFPDKNAENMLCRKIGFAFEQL